MSQTPLSAKLGLAALAAAFAIGSGVFLLQDDARPAPSTEPEEPQVQAPVDEPHEMPNSVEPQAPTSTRVVARGPKLREGDNRLDFGVVAVGQELAHTFVLHNDGDADLEITKAKPSCGCAALDYDKVIPPGGEGKFEVRVSGKSVRAGLMSHRIEIESNQPDFWLMTIRAKVDASLSAKGATAGPASSTER